MKDIFQLAKIICCYCFFFFNGTLLFSIDLEPIDIQEDLNVSCTSPCNRFFVNYEAFNLTVDTIDAFNGDTLDYIFMIIRDAECNLVGINLEQFRPGNNSFGFASSIGENFLEPTKLPLTAYFVDIESIQDLPDISELDQLNPFLSVEILDTGTFNGKELPLVFPTPNCYPSSADLFIYGEENINEHGVDLIQTDDGGFILVGFTDDTETQMGDLLGINNDLVIKRIDADKNELWTRQYGGEDQEGWQTELDVFGDIDILRDVDGSYIISTTTASSKGQDTTTESSNRLKPWIFKINDAGDMIWETLIQSDGSSVFHDMVQHPSGGSLISFSSGSSSYTILEDSIHSVASYGQIDIGISYINMNGVIQWVHTVGDSFSNTQSALDITQDTSIIVLYSSESEDGIHSARLDVDGNVNWDQSFGRDQTDGATELVVIDDGTYLGATYTFGDFSPDLKLFRFDDAGIIWEKQYSTPFIDYVFNIFPSENGEIFMVGESSSAILLMQIDDQGNLLFKERIIQGIDRDFGSIVKIEDGFAVLGTIVNDVVFDETGVGFGHEDFFLTFLDNNFENKESEVQVLSGSIKTIDGIGISSVEVRLSSGELMTTDSTGAFRFEQILDFNSLTLNFSKDDDRLQDGLSSVDLVQILNHIIGILPFDNQLQIAAADLNNDGNVSSADLIILRNAILGFITELPNGTPLWRFSENHIPITAIPNAPFNIIANKVGDANGDAIK